jgi:MFS transporter, DHA2 family, methylenomycin A resistance protein
MTALAAGLSPVVQRVSRRFGLRLPIVAGQAFMATGLVASACLPATTPTWTAALLMIPVGVCSFTVPPLTSLLIDALPVHRAGTASGVLNMFRQMGASLGVASVGAVLATQVGFITGLRISLITITIAVLVAVTAIASLALRQSPPG